MMEKMSLQLWATENKPPKDMHFYSAYWDQIMFVRDQLTSLIYGSIIDGEPFRGVISDHVSKSVRLPVYLFEVKELQLRLILRGNFYDWKLSVESDKPVICDFGDLIDGNKTWSHHYCEGFEHHWIYDSFHANNQQFTVELSDDFTLYTFIWLLLQSLKK
ncbi:hypothetical protein JOD82_002014 [Paenibacillus sp. 1182]|nr:hypothetical protein [Paenibacillus sp. 1182]